MNMKQIMLKVPGLIGPWQALVVLWIVCAFVVGLEYVAAWALDDHTKVAKNVSCNVVSVETKDAPMLKLDCRGKEAMTANVKVVVSYLQHPGPVTCTLYKTGSTVCDPRKKT